MGRPHGIVMPLFLHLFGDSRKHGFLSTPDTTWAKPSSDPKQSRQDLSMPERGLSKRRAVEGHKNLLEHELHAPLRFMAHEAVLRTRNALRPSRDLRPYEEHQATDILSGFDSGCADAATERTIITGTSAWAVTHLPHFQAGSARSPDRPWVAIAIRSADSVAATSRIASATAPSMTRVTTVKLILPGRGHGIQIVPGAFSVARPQIGQHDGLVDDFIIGWSGTRIRVRRRQCNGRCPRRSPVRLLPIAAVQRHKNVFDTASSGVKPGLRGRQGSAQRCASDAGPSWRRTSNTGNMRALGYPVRYTSQHHRPRPLRPWVAITIRLTLLAWPGALLSPCPDQ